jgi:predicted NACHT family NTPase
MTGLETILAAAIAGITGIITDTVKEKGKYLLEEYDVNLLGNKKIKTSVKEYVGRYSSQYGKLKVACAQMDEPIELEDIYTSVSLLDRADLKYVESLSSLEELIKRSLNKGFEGPSRKKRKGMQIANEYQYLMVLGGPGVGKSTFLKKVGLEALKGQQGDYKHDCIPVMIELRQFDPSQTTLEGQIYQEIKACGFPKDYELTDMFLEKGKLLVLLDGIDEIPPLYEKQTIKYMESFIKKYSRNRFIISCRLAAYVGGFTKFKDVVMASFEDNQIREYMSRWFSSEQDKKTRTAQKCWELINTRESESAKELAQTPLLLTLLCVVYDQSLNFSKNRALLYGEALDVFLKKWSAEKRLERKSIYKEFNPDLEQMLLAEMAIKSLSKNQLLFTKQEAKEHIRKFLVGNLNAPKSVDSEEIIKAIEVQQGIFVERAKSTYSFSHLTLQEYLAAQYIIDNKREVDLIKRHLFHERWREVFLLSIGLAKGAKGADEFLMCMCSHLMQHLSADFEARGSPVDLCLSG